MAKTPEELEKDMTSLGSRLAQASVEIEKLAKLPPDDERRQKLKTDLEGLGLADLFKKVTPAPVPAKSDLEAFFEFLGV